MTTVVEVSHVGGKRAEMSTFLFTFNDFQILERNNPVVDIVDGKQGAGDAAQILPHLVHGVHQAQAWSDEQATISVPLVAAVLPLAVAGYYMGLDRRGEQGKGAGDIQPLIGENPLSEAVVDNRGCNGDQLIGFFFGIAVQLTELEGHQATHAGSQHIHGYILAAQVFVIPAKVAEPLGEGSLFQILGIGTETRHQRGKDVKTCFFESLGAVGIHRRGGGESVDKENCSVAALLMDNALCHVTKHLCFIGFKRLGLLVPISDEGGVPENEQNK